MVRILKTAFVYGAFFISFCDVVFLQAGDFESGLRVANGKKRIEQAGQKSLHEQRIIFSPIPGEIDELEKWQAGHQDTKFWIRAKAIREVLVREWNKMPKEPKEDDQELIKNYIEAIFRLDGILKKRHSLLFRILNKGESDFHTELQNILELSK